MFVGRTLMEGRYTQNRSAGEVSRLLRREIGKAWSGKSIHEISKRDVVEVISAVEQRGAPVAANKTLKSIKTFLRWCVGRAVLDQSPAEGVPLPAKEVARDRVLDDQELVQVILAARAKVSIAIATASCAATAFAISSALSWAKISLSPAGSTRPTGSSSRIMM